MTPVWSNRKICNSRPLKCTITIFFLVIGPLVAFSQNPSQNSWNQHLDEIYQGGARGFYQDLAKGLRYPRSSRQILSYGIILVQLKVRPDTKLGKLSVDLLNQLDPHIENHLTKNLTKILQGWREVDNLYQFILPIRFTMNGDYAEIVDVKAPESCPCLSPTVVHALSQPVVYIDYFDEYSKLVLKLEKSINQENHQKTMKHLKDLIRINPFVSELYQTRIQVEQKLRTRQFMEADQRVLQVVFGK